MTMQMTYSGYELDELDEYVEPTPEVCPYCGGMNTQFESEDRIHDEETHFCWDCEVAFVIDLIPW